MHCLILRGNPQPQNMETSEDEITLHFYINYVLNPLPTHREQGQCALQRPTI